MSQLPGGPIVGITMDLVTSFSERQPRKTGTGQKAILSSDHRSLSRM